MDDKAGGDDEPEEVVLLRSPKDATYSTLTQQYRNIPSGSVKNASVRLKNEVARRSTIRGLRTIGPDALSLAMEKQGALLNFEKGLGAVDEEEKTVGLESLLDIQEDVQEYLDDTQKVEEDVQLHESWLERATKEDRLHFKDLANVFRGQSGTPQRNKLVAELFQTDPKSSFYKLCVRAVRIHDVLKPDDDKYAQLLSLKSAFQSEAQLEKEIKELWVLYKDQKVTLMHEWTCQLSTLDKHTYYTPDSFESSTVYKQWKRAQRKRLTHNLYALQHRSKIKEFQEREEKGLPLHVGAIIDLEDAKDVKPKKKKTGFFASLLCCGTDVVDMVDEPSRQKMRRRQDLLNHALMEADVELEADLEMLAALPATTVSTINMGNVDVHTCYRALLWALVQDACDAYIDLSDDMPTVFTHSPMPPLHGAGTLRRDSIKKNSSDVKEEKSEVQRQISAALSQYKPLRPLPSAAQRVLECYRDVFSINRVYAELEWLQVWAFNLSSDLQYFNNVTNSLDKLNLLLEQFQKNAANQHLLNADEEEKKGPPVALTDTDIVPEDPYFTQSELIQLQWLASTICLWCLRCISRYWSVFYRNNQSFEACVTTLFQGWQVIKYIDDNHAVESGLERLITRVDLLFDTDLAGPEDVSLTKVVGAVVRIAVTASYRHIKQLTQGYKEVSDDKQQRDDVEIPVGDIHDIYQLMLIVKRVKDELTQDQQYAEVFDVLDDDDFELTAYSADTYVSLLFSESNIFLNQLWEVYQEDHSALVTALAREEARLASISPTAGKGAGAVFNPPKMGLGGAHHLFSKSHGSLASMTQNGDSARRRSLGAVNHAQGPFPLVSSRVSGGVTAAHRSLNRTGSMSTETLAGRNFPTHIWMLYESLRDFYKYVNEQIHSLPPYELGQWFKPFVTWWLDIRRVKFGVGYLERIVAADTWAPLSQELQYSNSVLDTFKLLFPLSGSLRQLPHTSEHITQFAQLIVQVVRGYVTRVSARVFDLLAEFDKSPYSWGFAAKSKTSKVMVVAIPTRMVVMMNNIHICKKKLFGTLKDFDLRSAFFSQKDLRHPHVRSAPQLKVDDFSSDDDDDDDGNAALASQLGCVEGFSYVSHTLRTIADRIAAGVGHFIGQQLSELVWFDKAAGMATQHSKVKAGDSKYNLELRTTQVEEILNPLFGYLQDILDYFAGCAPEQVKDNKVTRPVALNDKYFDQLCGAIMNVIFLQMERIIVYPKKDKWQFNLYLNQVKRLQTACELFQDFFRKAYEVPEAYFKSTESLSRLRHILSVLSVGQTKVLTTTHAMLVDSAEYTKPNLSAKDMEALRKTTPPYLTLDHVVGILRFRAKYENDAEAAQFVATLKKTGFFGRFFK